MSGVLWEGGEGGGWEKEGGGREAAGGEDGGENCLCLGGRGRLRESGGRFAAMAALAVVER